MQLVSQHFINRGVNEELLKNRLEDIKFSHLHDLFHQTVVLYHIVHMLVPCYSASVVHQTRLIVLASCSAAMVSASIVVQICLAEVKIYWLHFRSSPELIKWLLISKYPKNQKKTDGHNSKIHDMIS